MSRDEEDHLWVMMIDGSEGLGVFTDYVLAVRGKGFFLAYEVADERPVDLMAQYTFHFGDSCIIFRTWIDDVGRVKTEIS